MRNVFDYTPIRFHWSFNDQNMVKPRADEQSIGTWNLFIRRDFNESWSDTLVGQIIPIVNGKIVTWRGFLIGLNEFHEANVVADLNDVEKAKKIVMMGVMNSLYQSALRN